MSFTAEFNHPLAYRLSTFSKSANDELLKSSGLYRYFRLNSQGVYEWDSDFIEKLDSYLAGAIGDYDLNLSELIAIREFLDYEDERLIGAGAFAPKLESLDSLFKETSQGESA